MKWNGILCNYERDEKYEIKYGKGKVKEYNNKGKILYEGEYINGKREGIWKEYYYKEQLSFKTIINNNMKEYYINENRVNENVYLNARNDKNTLERYKTILKFEGIYSNGIKNGQAKEYYDNNHIK